MNLLIDELPSYVEADGQKYPIRSDFKTWLKFTRIIFSNGDIFQNSVDVIKLMFPENLPNRFDIALRLLMNFYSPPKQQTSKARESNGRRVYDFDYDAELIYSAFLQQYKIDLCTANFHWWQFKALFDCLTDQTQFIKVVQYRSMDLSRIKDKEQKRFYVKMKDVYRLPDNRTEEQKEADFNDSFSRMF